MSPIPDPLTERGADQEGGLYRCREVRNVSMNPPELQEFLASQEDVAYLGPKLHISPTLVAETKTTILDYHIRMIIVDRSLDGSGPVMRLFRDALGPPSASSGTFTMWADWRSFRGNG